MSISKILRDLREDNDITKDELAERFGIDRKTIWRIETEQYEPKVQVLIMYAKFFNVSLDYICGLTNQPKTLDGSIYNAQNINNGAKQNITTINGDHHNITIK